MSKVPRPFREPKQTVKTLKDVGSMADRIYAMRKERYELQHTVEYMKAAEKAMGDKLRAALAKLKATTVGGRKARVTLENKQVPKVVSWEALYEHIQDTGDFSLLHKRLSEEAAMEQFDAKRSVPGVQVEGIVKLSVEKL